jgi:hypothetical protein
MTHTKNQKSNIERLSKINFILVVSCFSCVFSYLILLGITSTNIVSTKSLTKTVDEKKTELATVELEYMNTENIVALESISGADFSNTVNISYVTVDDINNANFVALAKGSN